MYSVAVVADRETALGFKAAGAEVFPFENQRDLDKIFASIESGDYSLLILNEDAFLGLENKLKAFEDKSVPAVLVIPSAQENKGIADEFIDKIVQKAVGFQLQSKKEDEK